MKRRFLLAGAALASAACLVLLPAAASATVLATKYTPSYAGYYDVVSFNRGTVFAVVDVSNFTALVKVTSWIDAEIWLYSPKGTYKFVLGADPQTESTYQPKIMLGTTRVATCSGSFPQGSMVDDRVILSRNSSGHNVIDWSWRRRGAGRCGTGHDANGGVNSGGTRPALNGHRCRSAQAATLAPRSLRSLDLLPPEARSCMQDLQTGSGKPSPSGSAMRPGSRHQHLCLALPACDG